MREIKDYNAANELRPKHKQSPPLPQSRFHDLRHVHATLLLKAGVPVHVVAARLGHADPSITLRVYAHVIPEQAAEVADRFAALMDAKQGPEKRQDDAGEGL